jgi:histidine triad (HIT) family protein
VQGDCRFCAIARGDAEARVVLEREQVLGFLDRRPLFPGHVLLIPREHRETMLDAEPELLAALAADAQVLARAMEDALGAEGSFVAVNNRVSQSVPHLHVHVVPRRRKDGLRGFFWPRNSYRDDHHADEVQATLREAVARLSSRAGP